jgi:MoxR-like ATPase
VTGAGPPARPDQVEQVADLHGRLVAAVAGALRGKQDLVSTAVTCLLAGGHLLVEDVPGVGKTSLARALADAMGGSWHRIQFTPDLLPSDVTGVSVWDEATRRFAFRPGAVFAHLVVADEINRAAPKTQSALLEVMEERQVTVDAVPHRVPDPFLVVATQNPIDLAGTYALPEAQLDRFLMRVRIGYPAAEVEAGMLLDRVGRPDRTVTDSVCAPADVADVQRLVASVHVDPAVADYVVALVAAGRASRLLRLGPSPRASIGLMRAAQARAAGQGRPYVLPDDVRDLAGAVLSHRLLTSADADLAGQDAETVLDDLVAGVPVPAMDRAR